MSQSLTWTWYQRHSQLEKLIESPRVAQVRHEALRAASLIPQTDDNAASAAASHQVSLRIVAQSSKEETLGRQLDASLAVLWSAPSSSSSSSRDSNVLRSTANPSLKSLLNVALSESSRDLSSITCLESNREGTVELVRCRLDRKIYVLKSTTKGAAKRGYRSNAPVTERRLLSLSRQERDENKGKTAFTPACVAAFQSPGSLHILMDYCPAGDLYHFLESAGEAPVSNEARNKSGGLLVESYVKRYAIDMVAAIAWIHEQGFMHRDIKPGNWLFDKTGHLLLCDLASAAPFSSFDLVPSSANLPEADGLRTSKTGQRRVLHRHCCLIGTADYIAPEIFWSADLMSRRRERRLHREQSDSQSLQSNEESLASEGEYGDGEDEDDDEPPPDGPGLYGPECDWWSLGVVLFEMVYKRMPFFSEKIAETMEMIKNHENYFRVDSWVQCSPQLEDLIRRLISHSEKRLGFTSSTEVKAHPLFKGVDWSKSWEGDPVPFVPNLDATGHESKSIGDMSHWQQEPSILHSPQYKSDYSHSTHLSQMWSGDPKEFPAFPNSVDMSRPVIEEQIEEEDEGDQDDSETTLTSSSPSTRKALEQGGKDTIVVEAERHWGKFDPTWMGFSYVPGKNAFAPVSDIAHATVEGLPSPISSPGSMTAGTLIDSPQASTSRLPMVSTPCRGFEDSPAPASAPIQSTPFHPSVAHNLRRCAMETASRVRSETLEHEIRQAFATPLRKTSMPNLATQGDRQQMLSNLKTPANPSMARPTVPASPYPFPVASIARPRKTPAAPRVPSTGLKRTDLERARSASAGTGEGSDSRCSGGSNIKRDISEREAWRELQVAVMQSARKGRKDFVKELEEKRKVNVVLNAGITKKRPPLAHAATDSVIQASATVQPRNSPSALRGGREGLSRRASAAMGLGALSGALKGKRPNLPRFLSHHHNDSRPSLPPTISTTSPKRAASIISVSSTSSPPQGEMIIQEAVSSTSARSRLILPNFWNRHGEGGKLNKKRSARQLLLKAQDRETPTKIASRSGSPLLSSFQNLSLAGNESSSHIDDSASPSSKQDNSHSRTGSVVERSGGGIISLDSNDSTTSLGSADQSSDFEQRLSSPPKSALIAQLKRDDITSTHAMRRRDSTEMLSQYRKGINPDQTIELIDPTTAQQTLTMKRGPKRVMSIQVLQPRAANNRALTGWQGENSTSLSSPSLPSFPDAFGGELESERRSNTSQGMRRASMFPLRTVTDGINNEDVMEVLENHGLVGSSTQFRSLQSRRNSRMIGKRNSSNRLTIVTSGGGTNSKIKSAPLKKDVSSQNSEDGEVYNDKENEVGNVSMLTGLDWRYENMREKINSVEERLERIKARLRED